ncbi:hypothetical protein [Pseudoxanthomonas putridarboris]|uniref:Transposase n=1 Tax=Pseudoxanthomonas putridarboris TaxID=752605 RepID=A0ABU9J398_9GAMM
MAILTGRVHVPARIAHRARHTACRYRDRVVKKVLRIENNRRIVRGLRPLRPFFTRTISMKPAYHFAHMLDLQPSRCGLRVRAYAFVAKHGGEPARRLDT